MEAVAVAFSGGGVPGMEIVSDTFQAAYRYRLWKNDLKCPDEVCGRVTPLRIEVKTLPTCVDSRIGPPASMDPDGGVEDLPESGLDMILDGRLLRLRLPAVEISSVVGADALPTHVMDSCQCPPVRKARRNGCN